MRDSLKSFEAIISTSAEAANATWPFYTLPSFHTHAQHNLKQSGSEVVFFTPILKAEQAKAWGLYASDNYAEWIHEGHKAKYGSLNDLEAQSYHDFIFDSINDAFVPVPDSEFYYPMWQLYPPPRSYAIVNWNVAQSYAGAIGATLALGNESVATPVSRYLSTIAISEEQHNKMHSALPNSKAQYPHSFLFHPIHEHVGKEDSKIVAVLVSIFAWDLALRSLLPEGVSGIIVNVNNNCEQSYTYYLDGVDAIYVEEGDAHDRRFDGVAHRTYKLSESENRLFNTTPGHCQYSLVSLLSH